MTTHRVLITCVHLQRTIDPYRSLFEKHGIAIEMPDLSEKQQLSEDDLLEIIDRFDAVIAGDDPFTGKVLEKGKGRLKIVARWGIGMDSVDLETAKQLGIAVKNTPGVFGEEVADTIVGYMVLLARQLHRLDLSVREGGWEKFPGTSLQGKTFGVVGAGSIGRAAVRRAAVMGMKAIGSNLVPPPPDFIETTGFTLLSFEETIRQADFLALCCNLTPENYHMLGKEQFAAMKDGAYLVNTARGPLVDEAALAEALASGKIAGAALDVFEEEPLPADSPLRKFDNCIFGTHNASNTIEAVYRVNELAIQNVLDALQA